MRLKLKSAVALGFEAALLQCRDVVVGYDPQRKAASFLNNTFVILLTFHMLVCFYMMWPGEIGSLGEEV